MEDDGMSCTEVLLSHVNLYVVGGHRDNPDSVQCRAACKQVVVDSLFVPSKNKNCIEDMDSTLLRLSNLSQMTPRPSAMETSTEAAENLTPSSIVSGISNATNNAPVLTNIEHNIAAYLAGYLVRKTLQVYPCNRCKELLEDKDNKGHYFSVFLEEKQYSDIPDNKGLVVPSSSAVQAVTELENMFKHVAPVVMHAEKVRAKLVAKAIDLNVLDLCEECNGWKKKVYFFNLFITVRVHHVLREQNRKFQIVGQKRNRKVLKLMHL